MLNKILIVEDEINLGTTLTEYLNDKDYHCELAANYTEAWSRFQDQKFNIVLMDINLPDGDGIELATKMRNHRASFVLIYLSAQNDPETKFKSFEMGADDYLTKPFDLRELNLRLDKAIKTSDHLAKYQGEIKHGKIIFNFEEYYLITADGDKNNLGHKECAILEMLYNLQGKAVTRDEIIEKIWGENSFPTNRTVDNYIVKLRKWMETDPNLPLEIQSIRGVGYKLEIKE